MAASLVVRELEPADSDRALALRNVIFPPVDEERWAQNQTAAVAYLGSELVGVIPFAIRDVEIAPGVVIRVAMANSVGVADGHRGAGIGGRMMAAAFAFLPRWADASFVYTATEAGGPQYRFYRRAGYHDLLYPRRMRRPVGRARSGALGLPPHRLRVASGSVAACCNPHGCDQFFGARYARRAARRYRKHGLDTPARRMVDFLEARGLAGATVLEVGGGVGEIQLELLRRGAERAVNLELSPGYEDEAARLVRERGVAGRVERRLHDIAADPAAVEPADIVVLHRVVCCYPDYERLLSAAADHARRLLVFSHPPRTPVWRGLIGAQNVAFRLMRREFRAFAHPPQAMLSVLARRGLQPAFFHSGIPWRVVGLERAAQPAL